MRIGTFRILNYKSSLMLPINSIRHRYLNCYSDNYQRIMDHLRAKLDVPQYEWRRILKVTNFNKKSIIFQSLTTIEYLLKNGPPRVAQEMRNDMMFKIQNLMSFSYYEDNSDKGHSIREKCILIQDLVQQPQRLEVEREQARQYRDKFNPQGQSAYGNPAAIGSQYGGGSAQGYGGYGQNQESSGVISNAVGGLVSGAGSVLSGASSLISSGISYWKGNEQPKGYTGGTQKMMGFGSNDSGYMGGGGSTNYAPPGGGLSSYS